MKNKWNIRDSIPDLSLILSLALGWLSDYFMPEPVVANYPYTNIGWGIMCAASIGAVSVLSMLRSRQTSTNPFDKPSVLLTTGWYAYSRHPLYMLYVLVLTGFAIGLGSIAAWLAPLVCFVILDRYVIPREEAAAAAAFGKAYGRYRQNVRRWL